MNKSEIGLNYPGVARLHKPNADKIVYCTSFKWCILGIDFVRNSEKDPNRAEPNKLCLYALFCTVLFLSIQRYLSLVHANCMRTFVWQFFETSFLFAFFCCLSLCVCVCVSRFLFVLYCFNKRNFSTSGNLFRSFYFWCFIARFDGMKSFIFR